MTRERFPYLHDLLASTANQDEIEIWENLDTRLSHWQGQNWRHDTEMTGALAAEARRFDRRYPSGDPKRQWAHLKGRLSRLSQAVDQEFQQDAAS